MPAEPEKLGSGMNVSRARSFGPSRSPTLSTVSPLRTTPRGNERITTESLSPSGLVGGTMRNHRADFRRTGGRARVEEERFGAERAEYIRFLPVVGRAQDAVVDAAEEQPELQSGRLQVLDQRGRKRTMIGPVIGDLVG